VENVLKVETIISIFSRDWRPSTYVVAEKRVPGGHSHPPVAKFLVSILGEPAGVRADHGNTKQLELEDSL
jgi:hypothetical protein